MHMTPRQGWFANPVAIPGHSLKIGDGRRCLIIAEAGVNHNGSLELARNLIDAAIDSGADAVKFQTFRAERVVSKIASKAEYQRRVTDPGQNQYGMLKDLELTWNQHLTLRNYCRRRGILFLSTPHDAGSITTLERLNIPAFKVGSGDVTNLPYIRKMAGTGRPIILSTGMSTLGQVEEAVHAVWTEGHRKLILLHCVSSYPTNPKDCNLRSMETMRQAFRVPVGFSDHTHGWDVAIAAVALGAQVIEKHLTVDKSLPGPDHQVSLNPVEFRLMVSALRRAESSLGDGVKRPMPAEMNTIEVARKSIVAAVRIPKGVAISKGMLAIKRPGTGIPPAFIDRLIGRQARRVIRQDDLVLWEAVR